MTKDELDIEGYFMPAAVRALNALVMLAENKDGFASLQLQADAAYFIINLWRELADLDLNV